MSGNDRLPAGKFRDPSRTATGERRAAVPFAGLQTLWFNTGTLCNLRCANCYIESSPSNDALAYLLPAEAAAFLDEVERDRLPLREVGFTGGEPFMNPGLPDMLRDALRRGFRCLVLTNAMRPMLRHAAALAAIQAAHPGQLTLRVSLDHYAAPLHAAERGAGSFAKTLHGLAWLGAGGTACP